YDYANQLFQGGLGSRLNAVRALQEVSSDEARVEEARLAVRLAQEALGVLVAADGPIDTADEPDFEMAEEIGPESLDMRTDVQLANAREAAAQRVFTDSWKDHLPSLAATFSPQVLAPSGLFATSNSWRFSLVANVPVFDSGLRRGEKLQRSALFDISKLQVVSVRRQASSEVRAARASLDSPLSALNAARMATDQANEVVQITSVAFREGASTNIEVIDAQREALDAGTQAVIAEEAVRRARLDLLIALGRFPQ